ncbi:MAG: hypothetical protein JWM33_2104 [Caulobacteraceae bacterium]|nr:hypothetical protein [Caulobacteraceae bacterium]
MTAYTIVTTTATQGADAIEVSTLSDEFANESEAVGYSRRMAEEMVGFAHQLNMDFDYSNVGLYEGDLFDEDLNPSHPTFRGMWVMDEEGAAFVTPEEYSESAGDVED